MTHIFNELIVYKSNTYRYNSFKYRKLIINIFKTLYFNKLYRYFTISLNTYYIIISFNNNS